MAIASTGNRTRAARVAGEHSTTEPSMLRNIIEDAIKILIGFAFILLLVWWLLTLCLGLIETSLEGV